MQCRKKYNYQKVPLKSQSRIDSGIIHRKKPDWYCQ